MNPRNSIAALTLSAGMIIAGGAEPPLVLTEMPRAALQQTQTMGPEALYPKGTRLVLLAPPFAADHAVVLSQTLEAAGSPVVSFDGRRVVFVGRQPGEDWQVYEARLRGGHPRKLTSFRGGAAVPALLPDGSAVFAAPANHLGNSAQPAQLFAQGPTGAARQLTFLPKGAADPTVLLDGRILFVGAQPSPRQSGTALYTINNDGTEITAYAGQHDSSDLISRPRELGDRRVAFLSRGAPIPTFGPGAETVSSARPFASRAALFPGQHVFVRSVEPSGASNLLVCAQGASPGTAPCAWACFRVAPGQQKLGSPLLADPAWDIVEAVELAVSTQPRGRLSNMAPGKTTGQILCLDVNDTTFREDGQPKAARVRVLTRRGLEGARVLGEVAVQADGSFMAEVPADMPLGFEALDEQGRILRREEPNMWVRAGENRACIGCHAAHNRAPRNHRPLAVRSPIPRLPGEPEPKLAGNMP